MGSSSYFFALLVVSIGIGVYNVSQASSGSDFKCYSLSSMNETSYQTFLDQQPAPTQNSTSPPPATSTTEDGVTTYNVPIQGSNSFYLFQWVIAILYFVVGFFSLIMCLVTYWLSDMVPDDFMKISTFKKFTAASTKVFPPLNILVHWIIMVIIIIYWVLIITGTCEISQKDGAEFGFNPLKYSQDVTTLNIVNSIVWFVLHYGFAIMKDMIYTEPFMYAPQVGEKSVFKDVCFRVLGP